MDANFNSLPPLKRFRLLQQQEQQQEQLALSKPKPESVLKPKALPFSPSNLPAKKRKYTRDSFFDFDENKENIPPSISPPTSYCLPAKKRIWAIKPELSPVKSTLPLTIDLNLEYDPSVESKVESDDGEEESIRVEIEVEGNGGVREEEEGGEGKDDDDDDGILCAVCESTDGDPSDPIVFCDGCELMVHSTCYGNPLVKGIPEGEWFCAQCSDLNSQLPAYKYKCRLCPATGGAMKPTSDGQWAHIVCAVLVPEVFFEDPEGRDGIDCSKIPKRRWRDMCYLCKGTNGCAIQCSEIKCPLAFHVSCGLKEDLTIELKEGKNTGGIVAGFCKKHTQLWKKQKQTGKFKIVARDEDQKF